MTAGHDASTGTCCEACATRPVSAARADLVTLEPGPQQAMARAADRRITVIGIAIAGGFLAAAFAALALPAPVRHGLWLPIHLGLAGAAGTAIASVLPFFVAALSVVRPMGPRLRGTAIALVSVGALTASLGVVGGSNWLAVAGASCYVAGLGAVSVAAFWPVRSGSGRRRRMILAAYGAAIAMVAVSVTMAGTMLAGYAPVVDRWGLLKPAHAWLNVFGFVSVTVAATLVHLAPTVAGARIVPRRSAGLALTGLAGGAPLVALGFVFGSDILARIGAVVELSGAVGLVIHAAAVHHDRGHWTTDPGWHRVASGSLTIAPVWLLVAVVVAAGRVLVSGAVPAAWSLDGLAAPLAVGWVVQVLIGAWTQLLPAIGPGDMAAHARQRTRLGRAGSSRVVALNLGVAAFVLGDATGWTPLVGIGLLVGGGGLVVALAILFSALGSSRAPGVPGSTLAARGG
jgi:nitrite reductase (NO-forming)